MSRLRKTRMGASLPDAMALGEKGLLFLAESPDRLQRFLYESGMGPEDLRAAAGTRETLAAVLSHLLSDESMLLVFTAGTGIEPRDVHMAEAVLSGTTGGDGM